MDLLGIGAFSREREDEIRAYFAFYNYIGNVIIHEDHRKQRRGRLSAAAMLVIAPSLIAFFIFQRQFISSFMMSGIK